MAVPSSSSFTFPSPTLLRHPLCSPITRPSANDVAISWILEFILRKPVPDSLANEILLALPFYSSDVHPHLRKTLLLRRISSDLRRGSLSERTLHSLELIANLDRHRAPTQRMKAAYCAAAVECTAGAFPRCSRDLIDAIERILMAEPAEGLVSEQLMDWAKRMERCLSSGEGGEDILKRDVEDAMRSVRDYLEEAMEEMGPSFLEIAAAEFAEKRMDFDAVADNVGKGVTRLNGCFEGLDENEEELENDGGGISKGIMDEGGVLQRSGSMVDNSRKNLGVAGISDESDGLGEASTTQDGNFNGVGESGFHSVEMEVEDNGRGVNVGGHDMPDHSECKVHQVDPGEVSKVKDALKKSCFDLKRVVEDPLPEAQAIAAAVLDSIYRGQTEKQSFVENQVLSVSPVELDTGFPSGVGTSTCDLEKDKGNITDLNQMEGDQIVKACNMDARPSKRRAVVPSHGLFERNPSAHTNNQSSYDSMESSVPIEKRHSFNPMSRRISPTRLNNGKVVKRRVVKRWAPLEEHTLREAVAKYGKGNWKLILNCHSETFKDRTEVDLKDKWRNMARHLL